MRAHTRFLAVLLGLASAASATSLGALGSVETRVQHIAFAGPHTFSSFRRTKLAVSVKQVGGTALRDAVAITEAGVGGGSIGGGNSRGGWGGRWDGGQGGGGQHGRFNGLAYVQNVNKGPRLTNRTVLEDETGIKFPPALLLDQKDKKPLRFLGAGCAKSRSWKSFFRQTKDYALGLYLDADMTYSKYKKQMTSPEKAEEALLQSYTGITKTIRIVLNKEVDSFTFTTNINDRIESQFAAHDFEQLVFLDVWRYWMVDQGGYHQTLPKGTEIRLTWKWDEWEEDDCFITEFRKRDRILATKKLYGDSLPKFVFKAFLGKDDPVSKPAREDILNRMMNLCR